jgi:hypothetical protein
MFIEWRQAISRLQLEIMRKGVTSQFGVTGEMTFRVENRTAAQRWKEKIGCAAIQE